MRTTGGRMFDVEGTVEFRARYRLDGDAGAAGIVGEQHEVSRFVRESGTWFYLDALA